MREILIKKSTIIIAVFTALIFSSGTPNEASAKRKLVKVDGSSTVFPITEAVAEEFQIEKRGKIMVTVGVSGTGGGFKKFCRGEIDIADASRPIKSSEIELCKAGGIEFIELPIAYDGLAITVNPTNTWAKDITVKELHKIWRPEAEEKITNWSQIRKGWPDKELHLFGPGTDSGTFDYFTKVINGKNGATRGDFTASEDDNVLVQGISTDKGALGYFGIAYYEYNKDKLTLVAVDDGDDTNGKGAILPSTKTINNGTYSPLSRPIFIYISKSSLEKPEVLDFARFYINNSAMLSEEVGYIPLTPELYSEALKKIKDKTTGTSFGEDK
jgi:phosphate transport system substrate-binding protein